VKGTAARQGSLRRLGHGGWGEPMVTFGTTGSTRLEGRFADEATYTCDVVPAGSVSSKDQIGWVPFGAAIVTRIREPAR